MLLSSKPILKINYFQEKTIFLLPVSYSRSRIKKSALAKQGRFRIYGLTPNLTTTSRLPGHEESYNPPPEYLFTEKEKKEWERATAEGHRRKLPYVPQKYAALRKVPAWQTFIQERFERCLDLYLAPRLPILRDLCRESGTKMPRVLLLLRVLQLSRSASVWLIDGLIWRANFLLLFF